MAAFGGDPAADWLIIDCAGPRMLVARLAADGFQSEHVSTELRGQSEQLNVAIMALRSERSLASLTKIIVNRGPGSFTGVRVALATAYGLSRGLGNGVILHPISAFAAHRLGREQPQADVLLESRRPEKYHSRGAQFSVRQVDQVAPEDSTITDIVSLGSKEGFDAALLTTAHYYAAMVAGHSPEAFEALYVRPPDVGPQAN